MSNDKTMKLRLVEKNKKGGEISTAGELKDIIEIDSTDAVVVVNGQLYHLDSFVLGGENMFNERVNLIHNCSTDDMAKYERYLNVQVTRNIEQTHYSD
ncbi:hypothetical protein GCM10007216_20020 [Thalassobacillus devorans]|uniref:Uncharacterized protein n=1 Tax=Thalassobacillus devorans TaxID=279813 RepID=A0ABQ1P526_9BACI|nr:DUF3931 domain-containing protein [Thalassobacillus devorans]NIK28054.1 hypothetical protein [Thalassobacillus devorans]GGC89246.1 hypothetical protein GCM10007216_20020 [Thalassobacillus devorans]